MQPTLIRLFSAVAILIGTFGSTSSAQDLDSPHSVGFRVHRWEDPTRSLPQWPAGTNTSARPVRVFEWYPAVPPTESSHARALTWSDYVMFEFDLSYLEEDPEERSISPELREAALATYSSRLVDRHGLSKDQAETLLNTPLRATEGLADLPGRHPLIIIRSMPQTLGLLAEELASRGYVVLAPSYLADGSRHDLYPFPSPAGVDRAIRDLQFSYSHSAALPNVDTRRLGLLGFSSATIPNLLWQMQDQRASAVVAIEGWEGFLQGAEVLEENSYFRPRAFRVPHLLIEKAAEERDQSYAKTNRIFETMHSSQRERVTFELATHFSFLSQSRLLAAAEIEPASDSSSQSKQLEIEIHDSANSYIIDFFERHLTDRPGSQIQSSAEHTTSQLTGLAPMPTQEELARLIEAQRFTELRQLLDTDRGGVSEPLFDRRLLRRVVREQPEAEVRRDAYRLIAETLATSTWAWIDLATAAEDFGDAAEARLAYQRALDVVDADDSLSDERKESLRSGLRETLESSAR